MRFLLRFWILVFAGGVGWTGFAAEPSSWRWLAHAEVDGLRVGQARWVEVGWTNRDHHPTRLPEVHPTSDHVEAVDWSEAVEPGARGYLRVRLHPAKPGRWDVAVFGGAAEGTEARSVITLSGVAAGAEDSGDGTPEIVAAEAALWITPSDLATCLAGAQPPAVVDLRPAEEFQRCAITGALNLALFSVRTRPFLRGRELVLVGRGHDDLQRVRQAGELRNAGFPAVRVLRGGMNAWVLGGGGVAGTAEWAAVARVSARELLVQRPLRAWRVAEGPQGPGVAAEEETLRSVLGIGGGDPLTDPAAFLRLGPESGPVGDFRGAGTRDGGVPRFWLEGGAEACLREFLFGVSEQQRRTSSSDAFDMARFIRSFRSTRSGGSCCGGR